MDGKRHSQREAEPTPDSKIIEALEEFGHHLPVFFSAWLKRDKSSVGDAIIGLDQHRGYGEMLWAIIEICIELVVHRLYGETQHEHILCARDEGGKGRVILFGHNDRRGD